MIVLPLLLVAKSVGEEAMVHDRGKVHKKTADATESIPNIP